MGTTGSPARRPCPSYQTRHWRGRTCRQRTGARSPELLVDKIVIAPHPHKIDKDGRRHYTIRAIPYQDPQQEAERPVKVHEARVKIVPRV